MVGGGGLGGLAQIHLQHDHFAAPSADAVALLSGALRSASFDQRQHQQHHHHHQHHHQLQHQQQYHPHHHPQHHHQLQQQQQQQQQHSHHQQHQQHSQHPQQSQQPQQQQQQAQAHNQPPFSGQDPGTNAGGAHTEAGRDDFVEFMHHSRQRSNGFIQSQNQMWNFNDGQQK
jgi:hypothetical protein